MGTAAAAEDRRGQHEAGDAGLDRLRAPGGDVGVGGDDEQARGAAVAWRARPSSTRASVKRLRGSMPSWTSTMSDPDRDVAVEQEDDDVGAVLGGPDLGEVDRDEARLGVGGERDAERLGEELGGRARGGS